MVTELRPDSTMSSATSWAIVYVLAEFIESREIIIPVLAVPTTTPFSPFQSEEFL